MNGLEIKEELIRTYLKKGYKLIYRSPSYLDYVEKEILYNEEYGWLVIHNDKENKDYFSNIKSILNVFELEIDHERKEVLFKLNHTLFGGIVKEYVNYCERRDSHYK